MKRRKPKVVRSSFIYQTQAERIRMLEIADRTGMTPSRVMAYLLFLMPAGREVEFYANAPRNSHCEPPPAERKTA